MTMAQRPALLELSGITKLFHGKPALDGVDISVPEGATVTLFGPNGAGKTTLLKIMAGLMLPGQGSVLYRGKNARDNGLKQDVFYLGHKNGLYNGLTVSENMSFILSLFGRGDARTQVDTVLRESGLWERRNDSVSDLSQGMKRRLAIAKSFMCNPSLLILDEPFAGLDLRWRTSVLDRIKELKRLGRSLVLATHLIDEGMELADYVGYLEKGKLRFLSSRDEVAKDRLKDFFCGQEVVQ